MGIEIRNVSKTFNDFSALREVSLSVLSGEMLALLGPSGSGKTTLLRIIAGLEIPDAGGEVKFDGPETSETQTAGGRRVGFVFQHYALFRHMTVFENIAFGLQVRPRRFRPSREEIRERVRNLLQLVQLEELAQRMPTDLSGGQRQRVALARALAVEPSVLLLDEPFGALDARVRQELRRWLRRLQERIHLTCVLVTHDQEEAMEVADRVVVMNQGRVEQLGTPEEVYHFPASEFVLNFLGNVNLFHVRVEAGKTVFGPGRVAHAPRENIAEGDARVFIRPHDLEIHREMPGTPAFTARIVHVNSAGPTVKVELSGEDGETFFAEITHERHRALNLAAGENVFVLAKDVRVFPKNTTQPSP